MFRYLELHWSQSRVTQNIKTRSFIGYTMQILEMQVLDIYVSKWGNTTCKITLMLVLAFGLKMPLLANEIAISNISLSNHDATNQTVEITFDVTWNNSWRHPVSSGMPNWDAAWIFGRFSLRGENTWLPIVISAQGISTGSGTPSIAELKPYTNDDTKGIGMLVHRSEVGSGTFSQVGITFTWEYGNNRPDITDLDLLEIRLFGIEMVYVPGGPFYLGSGQAPFQGFYTQGQESSYSPYRLETLGSIILGGVGSLTYIGYSGTTTIPSGFPNGVYPFYIMKHELSEQMMVNFLNSVDNGISDHPVYANIKAAQDGSDSQYALLNDINRTFEIMNSDTIYNFTTNKPEYPANFMSWNEGTAIADWAGMRPISELEFEKASRGWKAPTIVGEFPWGKGGVVNQTYTIANGEIVAGYSTQKNRGNAAITETMGQFGLDLRVGVFANDTSSRAQSNASRLGVLDLAGSVLEITADVVNPSNTSWINVHGNGELHPSGYSDEFWPGYENSLSYVYQSPNAKIIGRGGSITEGAKPATTSYRDTGIQSQNNANAGDGIRLGITRVCDLPTFNAENFTISTTQDLASNLFTVTISPSTVGQEWVWILDTNAGTVPTVYESDKAGIISGQGSSEIVLAFLETEVTAKLYVHSVNDCGISLESSSVELEYE